MDNVRYDVMYDFVKSCFSRGYQNREDNIAYFMKANNDMNLDEYQVEKIYDEVHKDLNKD